MKNLSLFTLLLTVLCAGCKKEGRQGNDVTPSQSISLPDSTLFVGTGIGDSTVVYLLNAVNGSLVNRYTYKSTMVYADNYIPLVGNGFLYVLENSNVNALEPSTGKVQWTSSINNESWRHVLLHQDTFYGLSGNYADQMKVFALDATKKVESYLWQYDLGAGYANTITDIRFENGLLYIVTYNGLSVLDPKTGSLKWSLNVACSLASLKNSLITSENKLLDAVTGALVRSVPASLVSNNSAQTAAIIYADQDLFFTQVREYKDSYNTVVHLNVYDAATNVLKWSSDSSAYTIGGYVDVGVDQILNGQAIIRTVSGISAGKYGTSYGVSYSALEKNTGAEKWSFEAGILGQNFQVGQTLFSCGTFTLDLAAGFPASSTISAADLTTGRIVWQNNDLKFQVGGSVAACVSVKGKGYAADIQ